MNLIICTTPFQVLLAEKIIAMNPNEEYIFRFISNIKNNKTDYYFNRLKSKIRDSEFIHVDYKNGFELIWLCIKYRLKGILNNQYSQVNKIILGSIDNNHIHIHIHIHNIIHKNNNVVIETFDDGTANLDKNSFFYRDTNFSKKIAWLRYILCCSSTTMALLKNKSQKHYSIYKDKSNIIDNVVYIKLFNNIKHEKNNLEIGCTHNKVVLFVGQPIYEMDKTGKYKITEHIKMVNKLIDKLDIDYFFPHPRENNFLSVKNKYIETVKVFEDFFFGTYSPNTDYMIYTFFSGSVISLMTLPNVKINLIKIKDFPTDLSCIYEMMQDNFNFSIVEVEND